MRPSRQLLLSSSKQKDCTPAARWLLLLLTCLTTLPVMARTWYVVPNGSGNGSGSFWNNAADLWTAMDQSVSGDNIYIKTGTYTTPVVGTNLPSSFYSFSLRSGVKVYGGFAGTNNETGPGNRSTNLTVNVVTLNKSNQFSNYPIVDGSNTNNATVLDRVTIAGGYNTLGAPNAPGGLLLTGTGCKIQDVTFSGNTAFSAGAVYCSGISTLQNVTFTNNKAISGNGGAVYVNGGSDVTFTASTFTGNSSENGSGGAIYADGAKLTITNYTTFTSNSAKANGGAISYQNSADGLALSNTVFKDNRAGVTVSSQGAYSSNNTAARGGAIYLNYANCFADKVAFYGNPSGGYGGAIFNTNTASSTDVARVPKFTNTVFYRNSCLGSTGYGGAIADEKANIILINNTFAQNATGQTSATPQGGGLYVYGNSPNPTATITNCVFYLNSNFGSDVSDVLKTNTATINITYSSFNEVSSYGSNTNNIRLDASVNPFVQLNTFTPEGADGTWFTNDDLLQLTFCAEKLIDKGNNDAISDISTDITGRPRKWDVGLIDGGSSTNPVVDMGAYENQSTATNTSVAGIIGNAHTIPTPQEKLLDTITSTQDPIAGAVISWEKKPLGSTTWVAADPPASTPYYLIPGLDITTDFRRVTRSSDYCSVPIYSNVVTIKVVSPNGVIRGRVASTTGTGVQDINIKAIRKTPVSGGPAGYTYTTITDNNGNYLITPVYYGDPDQNPIIRDTFWVVASRQNHRFRPDTIIVVLTRTAPEASGINFTDTTVLTISGRTYQQCDLCTAFGTTTQTQTQTCPIDSVTIFKDGFYNTTSGYIDSAYGRFVVSVTDPVRTLIEPRLTGHKFNPVVQSVTPINNITGVDFTDTTTHNISGRLSDGCGRYIGTATLEFTDILSPGPNNTVRPSCFRKVIITNAVSGFYSINLPARRYRVRVLNLNDQSTQYPVDRTEFYNFFNSSTYPADSLIRDISNRDTTLNILFNRKPEISIASGLNPACTGSTYSLIRQTALDSFVVKVTQGPAVLGCPVRDTTKLRISTNIQTEDQLQDTMLALADTGTKVILRGGIPIIVAPYLKDLRISFKDKYGRLATDLTKKVLVTGVKSDAATFTTVSPEVPLIILHDPPGDASYSTWQQNQSITNAMRMYAAVEGGGEVWGEVKLGQKYQVGTALGGFFAAETEVWGTLRGSIGVKATTTPSNESIITTTTSQSFSTSGNPEVTGNSGDVYIGAALNLIYAVGTQIGFNNCAPTTKRQLIIADNGFNTQYIYSEDFIVNTLIPNLQSLAVLQPDSAARYLNQVSVWQQVVSNNAANKRRASFVQNYSFDGSAGPYTNTTTASSSKTSSLEFAVELNASVAVAAGLEVAGSGFSGGVNVNFRMETGGSTSSTTTNETTIGYTLDDNTPGDYFSVDVKKDPVYNTPVFELAAGTASCPMEPGAQPRDAILFTTSNPVVQGANPANPASFFLKIINISPSTSTNPNDKRTYKLSYIQNSNVANETITIAGTPYNSNSPYITRPLGYFDSTIIPVSITRQNGSSVYSYEGEQFTVSNTCDEDLGKTVALSAYFTSPCSSISLAQPADGWVVNTASNNLIFIKPTGYDVAGLSTVNVQYSTGSTWNDGPYLTTTQLANGFNFDLSTLPDGAYSFRLRLDCNSGTVFSQRTSGIIDRRAPQIYGRPDPTDDNYVNGDLIGITYDEKLNTGGVQVRMIRLSNNALLPFSASILDNKLTIVPDSSIKNLTGDSIRIIVSGIRDVYGNLRIKPDTTGFTVGTTVPATGNRALSMYVTNGRVYKNNDTGTIRVYFTLPVAATVDTRINFAIGGTARYNVDYSASYTANALYVGFNGSTGSLKIPAGQRQVILTLRPIAGDTSLSPDKTIIISATEGGDYALGTPTSVTATLTSEDGINVYTFTGDGNWSITNNWANGRKPLSTLVAGKEIIINPSGICVLNVPQTIRPGAKITVKANRRLVIQGNLKLN